MLSGDIPSDIDHPHACGDKPMALATFSTSVGSSPRVWGQVVSAKFNAKRNGIIPTRVGTSITVLSGVRVRRDHPHACGDKYQRCSCQHLPTGSSPRVWGQESKRYFFQCKFGIIPTRVGTSYISALSLAFW